MEDVVRKRTLMHGTYCGRLRSLLSASPAAFMGCGGAYRCVRSEFAYNVLLYRERRIPAAGGE